MKTKLAICFALAATGLAICAAPASAQGLPPHEIITSIWSAGLEPIARPVRQGPRYFVRALDGLGAEVMVTADAYNGRVISVRPISYAPVYAGRPYGAYPDYFSYDPVPPRGIYGRAPQNLPEPRVIYGSPNGRSLPPARVPSAAKPPAAKVAAKKPPVPAAAKAEPTATASPEVTGSVGATAPSSDVPQLAVPPVQSFD